MWNWFTTSTQGSLGSSLWPEIQQTFNKVLQHFIYELAQKKDILLMTSVSFYIRLEEKNQ